jgi:hypothetical protein
MDYTENTEKTEVTETVPETRGLILLGVQRARSWRGRRGVRDGGDGVMGVRYRDLEALVRVGAFQLPELDPESVQAHQRVIDTVNRRSTLLPAPYGIVFQGRRPLIRMLQDQYLVIDEALSFVDGHYEIRMHLTSNEEPEQHEGLVSAATQIYSSLRRLARAAVPFPCAPPRLLSAAFLVPKTSWVEFIQRADDLGAPHIDITVDTTGPWPPYDFVRFVV